MEENNNINNNNIQNNENLQNTFSSNNSNVNYTKDFDNNSNNNSINSNINASTILTNSTSNNSTDKSFTNTVNDTSNHIEKEQPNNFISSNTIDSNNSNTSTSFRMSSANSNNSSFEKKKNKKSKNNAGFGKLVVLPFTCGIIGAGIVIGTCFGIPSIREGILSNSNNNQSNSQVNTQQISLLDYSGTSVGVAQKVLPSIVGINVTYSVNSFFYGNQGIAQAQGSGVIISDDGYILTNNHVINSTSTSSFYELGKASKITVTLYNDENEYEATIVGTDEQTDLAVIKIDKTDLVAAELGDSDSLQVGEFCMAIGNPLGLGITVTDGIVSALDREVTDSDGNTYTAIQTNAAINSGNSGGALVNSKGQVIGINTLKVSGEDVEGVGFAIPINSTTDITDQLIEYNKVKRPYLGISGINVNEEMAKEYNLTVGVYVKNLDNFSSAERAGIKVGDVIVEADGKKVETSDDLNEIKNSKEIGDKLKITVWREGKTQEIEVTLQEQP